MSKLRAWSESRGNEEAVLADRILVDQSSRQTWPEQHHVDSVSMKSQIADLFATEAPIQRAQHIPDVVLREYGFDPISYVDYSRSAIQEKYLFHVGKKAVNKARRVDLSDRISFLRIEANEDLDNFEELSAQYLSDFVTTHVLPQPGIVLCANGNLRAIWSVEAFSVETEFQTDEMVSGVVSLYENRDKPGRYAFLDRADIVAERWVDLFSRIRSVNAA